MKNFNDKNIHNRVIRKPDWLKIKLHNTEEFSFVSEIVATHGLHTICSSGKCPNMSECWNRGTATFMIMGDICTRSCKFCATKTGKPLPLDINEPVKLARSVELMKLKHCVITSVDRDDLDDGGASHWVAVVNALREKVPATTIELLIPDFDGNTLLLDSIIASHPDIIGHNIETVKRITPLVRSRAKYDTSLRVLSHLADKGVNTKSGLMVGIGEKDDEVIETLQDLRNAGCRIVTIGQYLQPTKAHLPVDRYVHPDTFAAYKREAENMGFDYVESAPMVRSSYMAERAVQKQKTGLSQLTENCKSCNR
ncbi:MAG TPA: lipoyl synthase [Candidatus Avirikenella pullistercoris]|nr:lipoyl synthase [Candidatus Avirikenella pullistercoris]